MATFDVVQPVLSGKGRGWSKSEELSWVDAMVINQVTELIVFLKSDLQVKIQIRFVHLGQGSGS
jgi:hypothetical protein